MPHDITRGHGLRTGDELFAALVTLRTGDPLPERARDRAWDAIVRHVRRALPEERSADDRQDALVAIVRSVGDLRAANPASAAAWVRAICRNSEIDRHRGRYHSALPLDDTDSGIELESGETLPAELAHVVVAAFIKRVDAHLARQDLLEPARARRRMQALAAIYRLALGDSLAEIAARLDLDVSPALLTKWIERGRAIVLDVVEADRARDADAAALFAPFADLALARRADAGRPRPGRHRPAP